MRKKYGNYTVRYHVDQIKKKWLVEIFVCFFPFLFDKHNSLHLQNKNKN